MILVADFETSYTEEETWVYLWCIYGDNGVKEYGNDIDGFVNYIRNLPAEYKNVAIYFHNLKYDGSYIISEFLRRNYEWVDERKEVKTTKQFSCFIDDTGNWYSIDFRDKRRRTIHIYDSLKKIPLGVGAIAKSYNVGEKGLIDYLAVRPKGYIPTPNEINYCYNDCRIVYEALLQHIEEGHDKMTVGGDCMAFYRRCLGGRGNFKRLFPNLDYTPRQWNEIENPPEFTTVDDYCRASYKGAWCYVNPQIEGKKVGAGTVLDVNSLYPYVLREKSYPVLYPIFKEGKPEFGNGSHFIFRCKIMFELKKDGLPCIIEKNKARFVTQSSWLASSNGEYAEYYFTDIDWELINDNYIFDINFIDYMEFSAMTDLFSYYIDKFNQQKEEAATTGNLGKRQIAKLFNNNLYGKFGQNNRTEHKKPCMDDEGVLHFTGVEGKPRSTIYVPVAAFVTAYARQLIITAAKKIKERFCYADTDSLHFLGFDVPEEIPVDPVKLGCFKMEYRFTCAKYLRQKTYLEEIENGELNVTCAGFKKEIIYTDENGELQRCDRSTYYSKILKLGFDDFKTGLKIPDGKTRLKQIKGGAIVQPLDFTIL